MPAKKTQEHISTHLLEKGMILVSTYTGYDTPVYVKCQDCGHEWQVTPRAVITHNRGKCKQCKRHAGALSPAYVDEQLARNHISMVGVYMSTGKPVDMRCDVCGYQWRGTVTQILHNNTGCQHCAGNSAKSAAYIEAALPAGIRLVGGYTTTDAPATFTCSHNHTWQSTPANYLYSTNRECPVCAPYHHNKQFGRKTVVDGIVFRSALEALCYEHIKSTGIAFARQVKYPTLFRMTCDFVAGDVWIEVSSIKKDAYLAKIQRKREEVEKAGNIFRFVTSLDEFKKVLV